MRDLELIIQNGCGLEKLTAHKPVRKTLMQKLQSLNWREAVVSAGCWRQTADDGGHLPFWKQQQQQTTNNKKLNTVTGTQQ